MLHLHAESGDQQVYELRIVSSCKWHWQMQSPVIVAVQVLQCKSTTSSSIEGCDTSSRAQVKLVQA